VFRAETSRDLFKHTGRSKLTRNGGGTSRKFSSSMTIQTRSRRCGEF